MTEIVGVDIVINSEGARKGSREYDAALRNVVESSRRANSEFQQSDKRLTDVRRSILSTTSAVQALVAGGLGVAAVRAFQLGSAVEETGSKFRTVMGPALDDANRFLDDFAVQAGLSRMAAENLTATTAGIAQGMGFAQRASAGFAEDVVRLAADMASFNNLPTEDVVRRVTSALTGERESLKQLGVVITEVEVQQRALSDTGKASAAALTQQEKATATLALISEKAGVAVGDLARTQDSAANTARRVQARMADLRAEVATAFLPIFAELLGAVDDSAGAFDALGGAIRGFGTFVRTGIAEIQILGTRLAVLGAAVDVVQNAFATKANKRPFSEALEDFRRMQDAAAETREEILLSLNAAISQERTTTQVANQQERVAAAATVSTALLQDAAKAEADRLDALVELVKLRAEESGELAEIADRLARIDALQARGVADARTRLELLREETRLREALAGRIGTPTGGVVGGPRLAGGLLGPVTANNAGIEEAREALARLGTQAQDTASSTDSLSDTLLAGVEGVAALDRAVGFLPASLRGVVSGVADVVRGLQTSQSEAASTAQRIAGGAGIIGGIVSIGLGLLRASDEAKEQASRAREQLAASIRDFVSPLKGFQTDIQQAAEALDKLAGGTAFRANYARTLGSATEALDFLAREAARLGTTRAGEVVQALANRLNEARESFAGELELRRVAAEFGDEAAAQLRRQIEMERALAEARRLGIDEAVVQEAFAAEARRRAREEQTRAEEEYARAQRDAARAAEEAAEAQRRAAEIAAEVAQRIAEGNQALTEEIALRSLLLDGKDEEADLLRQEIRFREELNRAIEAGLDESLIDQLREIQRREREQSQDQSAVEDLIRSVGGAGRASRVDLGGVTQAEVFRTNDILFSSLSVLQEIAANTRAMVRGGVVNRVAEFGDQSPNIDQALGSQARTTSYQQGRVRL